MKGVNLQNKIGKWGLICLSTVIVTSILWTVRTNRWLQFWELAAYDQYFRWRPSEPIDERILIVGISESDIKAVGKWSIPDQVLAKALQNVQKHAPAAIGLDLYRDMPIPPGHEELNQVFLSTPNIIGIEKKIDNDQGNAIAPPTVLQNLNQVGVSDIVIDSDGKLRRGLLLLTLDGISQESLGLKLALIYLKSLGIEPTSNENQYLKLGQAVFTPFNRNDGGYVQADDGGYQILLNWHSPQSNFRMVSLSEVLANQVSPDWIRDRIVLIGSTAPSVNDFFFTPYSNQGLTIRKHLSTLPNRITGVEVHANLISQLLGAVIDGRPLLHVWAKPIEWLWILLWAFWGANLGWHRRSLLGILASCSVIVISLIGATYLIFLMGWWIPVVPTALALVGAAMTIVTLNYQSIKQLETYNQELEHLASIDSLTETANRRYFDQYLNTSWQVLQQSQEPISLIMCDVDFFKAYNDTYGHPEGDTCLKQIARVLMETTPRSQGLVARYGGEEFAIVLPKTEVAEAVELAEKIRKNIKSLELEHEGSQVGKYITLSFGTATMIPITDLDITALIMRADYALYQAKQDGRDRIYSIG